MLFSTASFVLFLFLLLLLFFQLLVGDPRQNWPSNCFGWFKLVDRIFSSWGIEWVSVRRGKPGERGVQCEAHNDVLHCEKSEVFLLETCTHTHLTHAFSVWGLEEGRGGGEYNHAHWSKCWCVYPSAGPVTDIEWCVCVCVSIYVCTAGTPAMKNHDNILHESLSVLYTMFRLELQPVEISDCSTGTQPHHWSTATSVLFSLVAHKHHMRWYQSRKYVPVASVSYVLLLIPV